MRWGQRTRMEISRSRCSSRRLLRKKTLLHELVHRFFSPRFALLRRFRAQLNIDAYARSWLMRYLEETLAEGFAQLKGQRTAVVIQGDLLSNHRGLRDVVTGCKRGERDRHAHACWQTNLRDRFDWQDSGGCTVISLVFEPPGFALVSGLCQALGMSEMCLVADIDLSVCAGAAATRPDLIAA